MQAFEVFYRKPGETAMLTVLTENRDTLEQSLADKDCDFNLKNPLCKITIAHAIPLSNVIVSHLSVTELLTLINKENHDAKQTTL